MELSGMKAALTVKLRSNPLKFSVDVERLCRASVVALRSTSVSVCKAFG